MWFCERFLLLNYFKYASRHLVRRFCYFVFLLADSPYFCLQEVTRSQAIEKEAFIRYINNIHHLQNLPIKMQTIDWHVSIKKLMKTDERLKHIKKLCILRQPKIGVTYHISILSILCLAVTKSYTCSNKPVAESLCWNIYCFLLQSETDWHMFNDRLVAVVGTSQNMTFAFRMIFIYSEKIRRILKFPFSSFVVYFKVNFSILFYANKLLTYQRMLTF